MLDKDDFIKWIEASHVMFEIFEGRCDAYPLARKWTQEWFSYKRFTVCEEDVKILSHLIQNFNYNAFKSREDRDDEWKNLVDKANQQFKTLIENKLKPNENENVGFAVAPYLFTWNFQRFKEYFKKYFNERKRDFDLERYFESLGEFLKGLKSRLESFRAKKLVYHQIDEEIIKETFKAVNDKLMELGIGNNEPIGTIKLLHVFAPYYFPLIDNDIARAVKLLPKSKWESLTVDSYLKWMNALKSWLQNYVEVIEKLERKHNSSILKLVDEGLYMMSTVKQRTRVSYLGTMIT